MGRAATSAGGQRAAPRGAELGKKALSIRSQARPAADARPRAGKQVGASRGRAVRGRTANRIDWLATLLNGRPRQRDDLRWQQRQGQPTELWLVIVDASASTRRHQSLAKAKGLLAQLFDQAYRQRARLALLTASGSTPHWQRHGLKASAALQPWLQSLGAGGGTPLLAALEQARQWLQARSKRHPEELRRCLVLTDGRLQAWQPPQPMPCACVLVDIETAPVRLGRARLLADQLQAQYQHISELEVIE